MKYFQFSSLPNSLSKISSIKWSYRTLSPRINRNARMVHTTWTRLNDCLVQYLATDNSSRLKIRIFLSKQWWFSEYSFSLSNPGALRCMPQYMTKVNGLFTFAFLWSSFQNPCKLLTDPVSYTKAFHKLNTDYAKFPFILNLSTMNLYSEEANNQHRFHAV